MAFCEPVTPRRPAAEVSPKFENSTLPSERFMAFAMSCVSRVPADPTTVPAMIMAALSSTKPSKPTASPVNALYSEITTGMSAPPMGSVIATPSSSEKAKNKDTAGRPSAPHPPEIDQEPQSHRRPAISPNSTNFWPPKRTDLVIKPCSFANAIKLPLNDTEPMKPPIGGDGQVRDAGLAAAVQLARRRWPPPRRRPCRCRARSFAACRSWQRACR